MQAGEYNETLAEQKRELERAKIAFRDERNAWKKQNYIDARVEQKLDYLEDQLKTIGRTKFEAPFCTENKNDNSSTSIIVPIADLHLGQTFKSNFGEYNSKIAKNELSKYLKEVVEIGKLHGANTAHVCCLGDEISGNIHKTIQVSNRENVIDQIKLASEYIASFCYNLCEYFDEVHFYSVCGNHSRIDKKDEALKDERLDDIVSWSVTNILHHVDSFIPHLENIDSTIGLANVNDNKYLLLHGDMDDISKNGIGNLTIMLGFIPDYIISAHKHTHAYSLGGVGIYQTGSFVPSGDDYTIEKRLSGKACQTVLVCDKSGVKCSYNVVLSK